MRGFDAKPAVFVYSMPKSLCLGCPLRQVESDVLPTPRRVPSAALAIVDLVPTRELHQTCKNCLAYILAQRVFYSNFEYS